MKYRHRLIVVSIFGLSVFVTSLLLVELTGTTREDTDKWTEKLEYRKAFENNKVSDDPIIQGWKSTGKRSNEFIDQGSNKIVGQGSNKIVGQGSNKIVGQRSNNISLKQAYNDESVDRLLKRLHRDKAAGFSIRTLRSLGFRELVQVLRRRPTEGTNNRLAWFHNNTVDVSDPNYMKFFYGIRKYAMYNPRDPAVDGLLSDMAKQPFESLEMMDRGTELKLLVTFPDGGRAVFKPMRWGREYETLPNHFYFNEYERHNSEIAAFHLDRLLGLNQVPPVTGRTVNMTREIYELAEKKLKKTFYVSPAGNLCFYGECTYYCDSRHSFCGTGDQIEGSLMAFLPGEDMGRRKRFRSPYRRSYSKFRKAVWETDQTYCDNLKQQPSYKITKALLDIIDLHIFDFITGNMDRHHIEHFEQFGNESHIIVFDNGRGFGKTSVDELSILAPLRQCCNVRESTFLKLAKLYIGPERLSELLDQSMKRDPVYPILTQGHLDAVDRRIVIILRTVANCVSSLGSVNGVIIKDSF